MPIQYKLCGEDEQMMLRKFEMVGEHGVLRWLAAAGLSAGLTAGFIAPAQGQSSIDIPVLNCGLESVDNNCLIFDDFTVLSLGLLQEFQGSPWNLYSGLDFLAKPNEATAYVYQFGGNASPDQGAGTLIDDPYDSLTGTPEGDNGRFLMASSSLTSGGPTNQIPSDPAGGPGIYDNIHDDAMVVNSSTFTDQDLLYPNPQNKYDDLACYADIATDGCMSLWDADIAALREITPGDELILLFQLNDTGDSGTLEGQDLLAWAEITLTDIDSCTLFEPGGKPVASSCDTMVYRFSGNDFMGNIYDGTPLEPVADLFVEDQIPGVGPDADGKWTGTDILETEEDKWAYVHSEICVEQAPGPTQGAVFPGECTASGFINGKTVNQALGADEAGFAIFNQELSDLVLDPTSEWDVLTIDLRHSFLNNGGEQLWFAGATRFVPVPATFGLFGLGLSMLSLSRRRQLRG